MKPIDGDALEEIVRAGLKEVPHNDGLARRHHKAEHIHFLDLIRRAPTIAPPPNDPLTLEELREMDGEPVWCVDGRGDSSWCLVNCDDDLPCCYDNGTGLWEGCFYGMAGDGRHGLHQCGWLAYRRKPEGTA